MVNLEKVGEYEGGGLSKGKVVIDHRGHAI